MAVNPSPSEQGTFSLDRNDCNLMLRFGGRWHLSRNLPSASLIFSEPREATCAKRLSLDTTGLSGWDSGLVSFLLEVESACRERGIQEDREGLPSGQNV